MTLELTGRRYSSEKESSLKPWTSCSLFLCLEDLAAVFPEECLKHLTAKWFFSPYLIQLSPQAGQSSCLFVCHFPQNLHGMTVLNPLSLGFMFSEVLPFDFPSEKNLPSSWPIYNSSTQDENISSCSLAQLSEQETGSKHSQNS